MNNENTYLPIFLAVPISIAVAASFHWAGAVVVGSVGLSIFILVLRTGWSVGGVESLCGISWLNLAGIWLWAALCTWFGILSTPHWPWFAGEVMVLLWLSRGLRTICLARNKCPCQCLCSHCQESCRCSEECGCQCSCSLAGKG